MVGHNQIMRRPGSFLARALAPLFVAAFAASGVRADVTFDWATVGNAGNANDSTGYGAVSYAYQISKTEVTNNQYTEFLNAKAASDPLALYNANMSSEANGGITRSGSSGSYTYAVKAGQGNQPVVFVSWYDSIRFANWMNNGQGGGDTESGAYTIAGGTPTPSNGDSITRNGGATIFLTSENEWYKAAYYQRSNLGVDSDNYWLYPTATNTGPNSDQPPGDPSILGNVGNFWGDDALVNGYNDGFAVTGSTTFSLSQNYLTDVGAYTASDSYYGTFDQGGNVWEWNEALISGSSRGVRGDSWQENSYGLRAEYRSYTFPTSGIANMGFRLASVPEPASLSLLALGGVGLLRRRRTSR